MKTYLAKIFLIGFCLFTWISSDYAQSYTAGTSSTEKSSVPEAWEISAAGIVDFVQLKDASGLKAFSNRSLGACPFLPLPVFSPGVGRDRLCRRKLPRGEKIPRQPTRSRR